MMLKLTIAAALVALVAAEETKNFHNYKVFRVTPTTDEQTSFLRYLAESSNEYNFWNGPSSTNVPADLMIAPEKIEDFQKLMRVTETPYTTYIENVQQLIDNENPKTMKFHTVGAFDWTSYHTLDEIYAFLEKLGNDYPDLVKVVDGGKTYEGRVIKGVKLSFKKNNPAVFIEGGIHAREWISPATVTYLLNEFLTSKNPDVRALAENNDWYIFPVFNPDGFVYTHTKNRLWRKSRKPYGVLCKGADLNRNWAYKWRQGGSSRNPCAETYAGTSAASDIETETMANYITSISDNLYAYLSFHSYSQVLLFPYGHTSEHLDNYDEMYDVGKTAIKALAKRYGTKYQTGNIAELMYVATGSTVDWAKGTFKIPLAYTYELRDQGRHGFLLPAKEIIPTSEEILDSLIALFQEAKVLGIPKKF